MTSKLLLLVLGLYLLFCFYIPDEISDYEAPSSREILNQHLIQEDGPNQQVRTPQKFESFKNTFFKQGKTDVDLDKITDLSIQLKRNIVRVSSISQQTLPMLVSLKVQNQDSFSKVPIDLVCVIDHSGSMRDGGKMDLAKDVFTYLIQYLDEADRLSIVIFDDQVSTIAPLTPMTDKNKRKILSAVNEIYARGGTNINLGMTQAFDILKKRNEQNSITSIFLLSDGLDEGAQHRVKNSLLTSELGSEIIISTFGFGHDHDPQLMTDIANFRDGNFYFIDKPKRIDEAFMDCLSGLMTSVAQKVQIRITPEQSNAFKGVKIIKAYGGTENKYDSNSPSGLWTYDEKDGTYSTSMTALVSGKQKDYVLELQLPYTEGSISNNERKMKVASAEAILSGFDGKHVIKKTNLYVTVLDEFEEFDTGAKQDNKDVMINLYRVKSGELMEESRMLADNNKFKEAKKILKDFKEEVENSFLKKEQFIENLIVDLKKALRDVEPSIYEESGRQYMFNNARSYMQQKSSVHLTNTHMNKFQVMTNIALNEQIYNEAKDLEEFLLTNTLMERPQLLTNIALNKQAFIQVNNQEEF